jgi:tetratricopeptide (TPR) repeat protein
MLELTGRSVAVALLAVGVAASVALASTQARVKGTVVDSAGHPIAGATITVTCPEAPTFKKVLESEADGGFRLLILDATKSYIFQAAAPGFVPYEQEVKVGVGTMDNEYTFTLQSEQESLSAKKEEILEQPGFKEYQEGVELLHGGKLDEARAKFAAAVAAVPDLAPAWGALADLDYRKADYAAALEHAKSCLQSDEENTKCLAIAANSAKEVGDEDAYQMYMARYQELNPDDPATLFNQAAERLNALDDENARPLLEKCLDVDPEFPACLFEYGMVLLRSGDLEGAKAHLEKYLEVAPDGPDAAAARETIKYL